MYISECGFAALLSHYYLCLMFPSLPFSLRFLHFCLFSSGAAVKLLLYSVSIRMFALPCVIPCGNLSLCFAWGWKQWFMSQVSRCLYGALTLSGCVKVGELLAKANIFSLTHQRANTTFYVLYVTITILGVFYSAAVFEAFKKINIRKLTQTYILNLFLYGSPS